LLLNLFANHCFAFLFLFFFLHLINRRLGHSASPMFRAHSRPRKSKSYEPQLATYNGRTAHVHNGLL
jgi:hypothetical protein